MLRGRKARNRPTAALAGALLALAAPGSASDFERDVRPILEEHCVSCHGPERQESLLRLDSRSQALRGGLSGEVILPGRSGESPLIQHLTGRVKPRMPHKKPALDASLVTRIAAWIDAGATGQDGALAAAQPANHWSYRKPRRPPLPLVRDSAWPQSPLDAFVLARLEAEGLAPSPEASRETLVRRLSLDLVGLPPTPAEVDAFLNDPSPGAYAAVVERLLASPHYGERWARPWLDLARYADTNGYEKYQRRTAWKYRDWVIDALNRDQSFRDFTIEQLAGDMLKDAGVAERIATGFHRNTQLNQEGGIDVEEYRFETLVDRVGTTGTVWLGTTIACAQCHNHKFDPVSQKDYYRLLAFFDNGEYRVHGQGEEVVDRWIMEPELELVTPELARRRDALRREAEALRLEIEGRDLDEEIAAFEREIAGPAPAFAPLTPVRAAAKSGASFATLADGSLRVSGTPADQDSYSVSVRGSLAGITAFRLEALPDASLRRGQALGSGAFVVTSLSVSGRAPAAPRARQPTSTSGALAALVLDAHATTGWGVIDESEAGSRHFLIVEPRRPLPAATTVRTLTLTLEFQSASEQASLGRFRVSATAARRPLAGLPLPEEVQRLVGTPPPHGGASRHPEVVPPARALVGRAARADPRDRGRARGD
jgi:cytochrome c553